MENTIKKLETEVKGRCGQITQSLCSNTPSQNFNCFNQICPNSKKICRTVTYKKGRNNKFQKQNVQPADVAAITCNANSENSKIKSKTNLVDFVKNHFQKAFFDETDSKANNSQSNEPNIALAISDSTSDNSCTVNIRIGDSVLPALIDSGATVSVLRLDVYHKTGLKNKFILEKPHFSIVRGVGGSILTVHGQVSLPVQVGRLKMQQDFHVLEQIQMPVILGRDFLNFRLF